MLTTMLAVTTLLTNLGYTTLLTNDGRSNIIINNVFYITIKRVGSTLLSILEGSTFQKQIYKELQCS